MIVVIYGVFLER